MRKNRLSIMLLAVAPAIGVTTAAAILTAKNHMPPDVKAAAEDEGYDLVLDSSRDDNFKYHYLEYQITAKNYQDNDVIFNYQRCYQQSDRYLVMTPGARFYNPYIATSDNGNGLYGMSSITVNFTTTTGELFISYGLEDEYYINGERLQSGVPYYFESFKPSHFELATLDDVNVSNDICISSISIHYHSDDYYDIREYEFENVYEDDSSFSLGAGASKTISLGNTAITTNNYVNINYKSTGNLKGFLNYYDLTKSKSVSEAIFLEPSVYPVDFNTFLDSFRKGSNGLTNKRLDSLVLTNVGSTSINATVYSVGYCDRAYSRTDTLYISDSDIELGVSLKFGGSISSVKNLSRNIQEYVDTNYNIKIRGSDKHSGDVNNVIRNNPNLINIHDVGREIQQSWYMNVDSAQGYTRGQYNDHYVSYNPVQAGDKNNNESQIVDYKVTYEEGSTTKVSSIWVKTKALDWAKSNELSTSYMENVYSVDEGLIKVKNRFIDFSGWTNYETNVGFPQGNNNFNGNTFLSVSEAPLSAIQELPAIYTAHPLNYFASYFNDSQTSASGKLVFDNTIGWNTGTDRVEYNSGLVANGTYNGETTYRMATAGGHYEFRNHKENWLGFFNEDKFGLAVYMPATNYNRESQNIGRHVFNSGMLNSSHNAADKINRYYLDDNYKTQTAAFSKGGIFTPKTDLTKDSCYMDNTGYLTSVLGFYPANYSAMEYTYLIGADYLDTLRSRFSVIEANQEIVNDFTGWRGAMI